MSRYTNTSNTAVDSTSAKGTTVYSIPSESTEDYYVISTLGDRFDILAGEYYNDSSLWYIIAAANPTIRRDSINIEPGNQIRIPLPLSKVLTNLRSENKNR